MSGSVTGAAPRGAGILRACGIVCYVRARPLGSVGATSGERKTKQALCHTNTERRGGCCFVTCVSKGSLLLQVVDGDIEAEHDNKKESRHNFGDFFHSRFFAAVATTF